MEATFVHGSQLNIDYTPSGADVAVGEVVVQAELVGVAVRKIPDGVKGALCITGVWDFAKATGVGTAIAAGDLVYWDNTANVATETTTSNKLIGKCVKAAGDNDATVRVAILQ